MTRTGKFSLIALLITVAALGACGLKGDLKTPPPIWGDGYKAEPEPDNMPTAPKPDLPVPDTR